MAQEVSIDINPVGYPTKDLAAEFDPQTKTVMAGDLVFWINNDENATHQPKPVGGADNAWVTTPISTKLDDLPGTSNTLSFQPGTNLSGVPYVCAEHPDETGTIVVLNNINIKGVPGAQPGAAQASFAPVNTTLAANEGFIWTNTDAVAHWPAPSQQQKTAWLQQAVQPGQKSTIVSFTQSSPKFTYVCALHPNETGTITVQ